MADSIDRVFAHALQTVRKLPRTGSARPPTSDRLRLYGLYKQSMEGDVLGVMARPALDPPPPATPSPESRAELEKWEAWQACAGLTRTQAKTKYIDTLIETMRKYASGTEESRGLVQELEFVWDQVRTNAAAGGLVVEEEEEEKEREARERGRRRPAVGSRQGSSRSGGKASGARRQMTESGLRVLRPMSEVDVEEQKSVDEDEQEMGDEEVLTEDEGEEDSMQESPERPQSTRKWHSRMENAVVRLTAEVAAVREQLDGAHHSVWAMMRSGGSGGNGSRRPWLRWLFWRMWQLTQRLLVDVLVLAVFLALWRLWMRWKRGERDPRNGIQREFGAVREGIEMVEVWVGFWWTRWREGLQRRFGRSERSSS